MKRLLALALCACASAAAAQVQVSFNPQGDAVVKKITGGIPSLKNIKVYEATICNTTPQAVSVHAGAVYQAAQRQKIATVGPLASVFIFARVTRRHPLALALEVAQWGSWVAGLMGASDTLNLGSNVKLLLPLLGQGFKQAGDRLSGEQPDYGALAKSILDGQLALPPSVCDDRMLFATSGPDGILFDQVSAISIPTPQPVDVPPAIAPAGTVTAAPPQN